MGKEIKQKDIVVVNLNPTRKNEQKGVRPCVVISGNAFHVSGVIIVCPLTSKIKRYPGDIILKPNKINCLTSPSEVLVGQVRAISLERATKITGSISDKDLGEILNGFDMICDR